MDSLKEIPQLLNDDTRADVKEAIVEYLLGTVDIIPRQISMRK